MRLKKIAAALALFTAGVACGGYLFSETLPRNFPTFKNCQEHCYMPAEITGLITSVGILKAPFLIPKVILESDSCFAIRNPRPESKTHYVLFPKHDTWNITTLTPADSPYILGCFALARELVSRDHLQAYRLYTNGPGKQEIAYLHFHLVADEPSLPAKPAAKGSPLPAAHVKRTD